jgi:hypothetical protein
LQPPSMAALQQQQRVSRHASASPQQQKVQEAGPATDPLWLLAAAADALPPQEEGLEGPQHSTPTRAHDSPSGASASAAAAAGPLPVGRQDWQQQQAAGSPCTSTTGRQQQRMQSGTQLGSGRAEPRGGLFQGSNPGQGLSPAHASREPLNPVAPAQAAVTLRGLEAELTRMVQAMGGTVPQFKPAGAAQAVLPAAGSDPAGAAAAGSQVLAGLMSSMQQQGMQGSGVGVGLERSQPELSVRATGPEPIVGLFPQASGAAGGPGVDYSTALAAAAAAVFAELHSKRQKRS